MTVERQSQFYLDAITGNDAGQGKIGSPWKTLHRLNRALLPGGSRIYYKYDSTWSTNAPYCDFATISDGALTTGWNSNSFIVSSGLASNSPTLSANLLTDGGLETWTSATNLTSWTETIAGTSTVNQELSVTDGSVTAARLDIDASNSAASIDQNITNSLGAWVITSWRAKCSATTSSMVVRENSIGQTYLGLTTTYTSYLNTHRALSANTNIKFGKDTSTSRSIYLDNLTVKTVSFSTCLAFRSDLAPSVDIRATASVTVPTLGALVGVAVKWDSISNPQSGLLGYIGGAYPEYIYLDKCVAGTWTNLIKVQMVTAETDKYLAGEYIEVSVSGTSVTLRYRGQIVGSVQTVSDSQIVDNRCYGLFSTDSSAQIHAFAIDYCTAMVTPEVLPSGISVNHQFNRNLYGLTTKGDTGGMASGPTGTATTSRIRRIVYPTRGGLYSGRFEIQNGDFAGSTNSGERAEVYILHNPAGSDVSETSASGTVYYGISLYIPTDWSPPNELDPNSNSVWGEFLQLHPPASGSLPSVSLNIRDTIYLANAGGDLQGAYLSWTETQLSDNSVKKGQWTDFVMKLVHANTLTGEIQIWRRNAGQSDFSSVLNLTGVPTLLTQSGYVDGVHIWRRGYYRAQQTTTKTNVIIHGPFVRGSTYNDVVAAAFSY